MASHHDETSGRQMRLAAMLALATMAVLAASAGSAARAAAAEDPCIATYDRHGNVTGRYCPDGSTKPPPAGPRRASRAPDAVDPEQTVPADERKGRPSGAAGTPGARAAPKESEIMCGQWKTSGKGCRGIFTILR